MGILNARFWQVGEELEPVTHQITWDKMVAFEAKVWDRGRTSHNDMDAAKKSGLREPIASGQNQMAFLHELLERAFGEAWTRGGSIKTRWIHPVVAEDIITAGGTVMAVTPIAAGWHRVEVELWCRNQDDVRTAVGRASANVQTTESRATLKAEAGGDMASRRSGALAGLRVLELTHAWAGPYCGMILADLGADVVKIERPGQSAEGRGGFPYVGGESVPYMMLHRNKRSMTLNLKVERGREILRQMLRKTDVVVQNMRPGALDRLGLSYADVRDINPGIVYASLSGFGSYGPRAGLAGVNIVAQAASGLSGTTMYDGRPPESLGMALCDIVAAIWCSTAILAALRERDRTGWGQYVDASLFEAGISLMMSPIAMETFAADAAQRMGRVDGNAPSGWFQTSDGRYIAIFASYPATWLRFIKALEMEELADDPRFAERGARTEHSVALHAIVADKLRTRPAYQWLNLLKESDVPAALVSTVTEVMRDPQVVARHMVQTVEHPEAGQVPLVRLPLFLSTSAVPPLTRPPLLGEHTDEVLAAIGLAADAEQLRTDGVI